MQFTLALLAATFALAKPVSKVVDLTPDNFDEFVTGDKHAMVEFYAPWCGHCKSLEPNWEKLALGYATHHAELIIGKVNADEHKELGKRFEVKGFPTIFYFAKGGEVSQPEKYSGQRDAMTMAKWVEEKTGLKGKVKPDVKYATQLGEHNWAKQIDGKKHVLLEIYSPNCGHCKNLDPVWQQLAKAFQAEPSILIAQLDGKAEAAILAKHSLTVAGFPTIKFLPKGASDWATEAIDYKGNRDLEDLVAFINEQAGTKRAADGSMSDDAGILAEMEPFLKAFFAAEQGKRSKHVSAASAAAKKESATKYYVKVMEKVDQQGTPFLTQEMQRLEKLLADDSITGAKADEFKQRLNIIKQFAKHAGIMAAEDDTDKADL